MPNINEYSNFELWTIFLLLEGRRSEHEYEVFTTCVAIASETRASCNERTINYTIIVIVDYNPNSNQR